MKKSLCVILPLLLTACAAPPKAHRDTIKTDSGSSLVTYYGKGIPGYGQPKGLDEKERYLRIVTRSDMAKEY